MQRRDETGSDFDLNLDLLEFRTIDWNLCVCVGWLSAFNSCKKLKVCVVFYLCKFIYTSTLILISYQKFILFYFFLVKKIFSGFLSLNF